MFTDPSDLAAAPYSNSVRRFIAECSDADFLAEAMRQEEAKAEPNTRKVNQLRLRVDLLRATAEPEAAPAPVSAPAPEVEAAPVATVTPEIADAFGLTGSPVVVVAPAFDEPTAPAEPGVVVYDAPAEPVTEAAPAGPADHLAATFVKALGSGNVALVAVMLGQVRIDKAGDADLAAALVRAYASQGAGRTARPVRAASPAGEVKAPRAPSDLRATRLRTAIEGARVTDKGVIVLTQADMERGEFPPSWRTTSALWTGTTSSAGSAARALGYTPSFRKIDGAYEVHLKPEAPVAE